MSPLSHGVDVVAVARLREACERNAALLATVFTERERSHCLSTPDPFAHLAERFAAKEACLKALGVGVREPTTAATLAEVEVTAQSEGRWGLTLSGWLGALAQRRGTPRALASTSHAGGLALAIVFLEPAATTEG